MAPFSGNAPLAEQVGLQIKHIEALRFVGWMVKVRSRLIGIGLEVEAHTFAMLEEAYNFEQVGRTRIAGRTEHAHKAFRRNVRGLGKAVEAHGRVDVVAQNCLGERNLAGQHGFEAFAQKFFPEPGVVLYPVPNGFFKVASQGHGSLFYFLS
ncbi:MAG: hypothetical protein JO189_23570 [Deltaproteobacteria bacterium]|nr:hypothetical protein [Deltaproteobacteria bacterium]